MQCINNVLMKLLFLGNKTGDTINCETNFFLYFKFCETSDENCDSWHFLCKLVYDPVVKLHQINSTSGNRDCPDPGPLS